MQPVWSKRRLDAPSSSSARAGHTALKQGYWRPGRPSSGDARRPRLSKRAAASIFQCPARWRTPGSRRSRPSLPRFQKYVEVFGDRAVILLDTYDTLAAARSMVASGLKPKAVRLDSGDVIALSKSVRAILDEAGLYDTSIFVSSDLDEWRIADMLAAGAPVEGFGVGAALSTSSDAPSLGAIYKLVEIERGGAAVPIMKRSPGKQTSPGRKQVWRVFDGGTAYRGHHRTGRRGAECGWRACAADVRHAGRDAGRSRHHHSPNCARAAGRPSPSFPHRSAGSTITPVIRCASAPALEAAIARASVAHR